MAILVMVGIRIIGVTHTMEFFGDIGRDHLELLTWAQTGKPPLLGPGTSFLPLHTPATFFYLNFPVFLVSGYSAYTTLITLLFLYAGSALISWKLDADPDHQWFVIGVFGLLSLHPEIVLQGRLPWNPSYNAAFLLLAVSSSRALLKKDSVWLRWLFALSLALIMSMHFSQFPVFVVLGVMGLVFFKKRLELFGQYVLAGLVVFAPLFVFEVRHNFFFVKQVLSHESQTKLFFAYGQKFIRYTQLLFGLPSTAWSWLAVAAVIGLVGGYEVFRQLKNSHSSQLQKKRTFFFTTAWVLVVTLTLAIPIAPRDHDLFGVYILAFTVIACLPRKVSLAVTAALLVLWLQPFWISRYARSPHRTVAAAENCAKLVCADQTEPLFVAQQAWHIFNSAPEYLFFFGKHGCTVRDITQDPNWSTMMALVEDQAEYTHGQTAFNELTLLGPSKVEKIYSCDEGIKVHILKRLPLEATSETLE